MITIRTYHLGCMAIMIHAVSMFGMAKHTIMQHKSSCDSQAILQESVDSRFLSKVSCCMNSSNNMVASLSVQQPVSLVEDELDALLDQRLNVAEKAYMHLSHAKKPFKNCGEIVFKAGLSLAVVAYHVVCSYWAQEEFRAYKDKHL